MILKINLISLKVNLVMVTPNLDCFKSQRKLTFTLGFLMIENSVSLPLGWNNFFSRLFLNLKNVEGGVLFINI
jgi:hypothetical protein